LFDALLSLATPWALAFCAAVLFVAYTLRGATGFGAGVVAIPLLSLALPLSVVIPVITALGIIASFGQSVQEIRYVDWRALRGLALPSAIGLALGLWLFASLDRALLLEAFASFIIAYGLWSLVPHSPVARRPSILLAAAAGSTGGLVATLFGGMAGPFYVIYLRALALDKRRFRASMSSVLLCLALLRAGGYGSLGMYGSTAIAALLLFAPAMVLGMLAGERWHVRLDQAWFERVVAVLLALSGGALLLR